LAALSQNGVYYVWGEIEYEPKVTFYKAFNEIFINYWKMIYKPIEGMIIQFEDSFVRKGNYEYFYREGKRLGAVLNKCLKLEFETRDNFNAIKKILFKNENEILKELEICLISKLLHKNILSFEDFSIERRILYRNVPLFT
jgi:hypothetical protein